MCSRSASAALVLFVLTIAALGCGGTQTPGSSSGASTGTAMNDAAFDRIETPSYEESECSPAIGHEDGAPVLKIAAPATLDLARGARFPLCGSYRLPLRWVATLPGDPIEMVAVVLMNTKTERARTLTLLPDKQPAEEAQALDPKDFDESDVEQSYFNVDLHEFDDGLTVEPGRYVVYATIQDVRSNSLEVEVIRSSEE